MNSIYHTMLLLLGAAAAGIGISGVRAQDVVEGSIRLLQGINDKGPWSEPLEEFDALISSPNATGNFPIDGPDISAPFSPSNIIKGWSWSIAVAADLPIANSSTWASKYGDKFYVGGRLTFNTPPQGLRVDDDLEICLFNWQLDSAAYPNKLRADNGSCLSVLTEKCISDLERAASIAASRNEGRCDCPRASEIPSCASLPPNDTALWDSTCAGSFYNASDIRAWEGKLDMRAFGGDVPNERGDIPQYDYVGSLAWPVMALWGDGINTTAKMSCVRAKDAAEGSRTPSGINFMRGEEKGDTADKPSLGNHLSGSWFALGAVLTSCILML